MCIVEHGDAATGRANINPDSTDKRGLRIFRSGVQFPLAHYDDNRVRQ